MIEITDKKECCGCTACYAICPQKCITMKYDTEGFRYPEVEIEKCVKCNLCENVCPILNKKEEVPFEQKAAVVQHKNVEICKQSTAGGAFTAIAEYVLKHDGVVFGAAFAEDYSVRHIYTDNVEKLYEFRNSKYVQSDLAETFREVEMFLKTGKLVCFSGTPCQIEGLINFLRYDYEKLILVDVVCRAVPSPGLWKKYVELLREDGGFPQKIRFRDKTLGYQYSTMEITDSKGKINREGIEAQPWLRMFFSGMIIRPSCTKCEFRKRYRNSDFTIWDCFNIHDISKNFDENRGTTKILIHNKKGEQIFNEIKENLLFEYVEPNVVIANVNEMFISPSEHENRHAFFEDAQVMTMRELIKKYFPYTVGVRIKKYARIFLNRLGLDKYVKRIMRKLKR